MEVASIILRIHHPLYGFAAGVGRFCGIHNNGVRLRFPQEIRVRGVPVAVVVGLHYIAFAHNVCNGRLVIAVKLKGREVASREVSAAVVLERAVGEHLHAGEHVLVELHDILLLLEQFAYFGRSEVRGHVPHPEVPLSGAGPELLLGAQLERFRLHAFFKRFEGDEFLVVRHHGTLLFHPFHGGIVVGRIAPVHKRADGFILGQLRYPREPVPVGALLGGGDVPHVVGMKVGDKDIVKVTGRGGEGVHVPGRPLRRRF